MDKKPLLPKGRTSDRNEDETDAGGSYVPPTHPGGDGSSSLPQGPQKSVEPKLDLEGSDEESAEPPFIETMVNRVLHAYKKKCEEKFHNFEIRLKKFEEEDCKQLREETNANGNTIVAVQVMVNRLDSRCKELEKKYAEAKNNQTGISAYEKMEKVVADPYKTFKERISDILTVSCAIAAFVLGVSSWKAIHSAFEELESAIEKAAEDDSAVVKSSATVTLARSKVQLRESNLELIFLTLFSAVFAILACIYAWGKV